MRSDKNGNASGWLRFAQWHSLCIYFLMRHLPWIINISSHRCSCDIALKIMESIFGSEFKLTVWTKIIGFDLNHIPLVNIDWNDIWKMTFMMPLSSSLIARDRVRVYDTILHSAQSTFFAWKIKARVGVSIRTRKKTFLFAENRITRTLFERNANISHKFVNICC